MILNRDVSLRTLNTQHIGQLICLTGTVTRTSEIRPELLLGTFACGECGAIITEFEQQFRYTEPKTCINQLCNNHTNWRLILEQSKFTDWQKIRVQENALEIPPGSMPRTIDVIVRNEMVDRAKAGDKCMFTGTLIVVPDITQIMVAGEKVQTQKQAGVRSNAFYNEGVQGAKSQGLRDLTYKLSFLASMVQPVDGRFGILHSMQDRDDDDVEKIIEQFQKHELEDISRMKHTPQLYNRLVNSIVPTIFDHDEIKRGLLLMLFGGVYKETKEGIHLRGDINICIVGDPSTAKSQFLK
jgi:DNA replication licensing factor MCM6